MKMKKIIKNKGEIKIDSKYVVSNEFYSTIANKEKYFKNVFIAIIRDNFDDTLIKLVDIKAEYSKLLPIELQEDEGLIQILKNLIGSNKDNKTSLVRDPNVDWYYCDEVKSNHIKVSQKDRKPIQLPEKLERSRRKKYYAFYTSIVDDSLATTTIEAVSNNATFTSESYNSIDFSKIIKKKIDYADKQDKAQKIGDIGEEYIFGIEKQKMISEGINKEPIWISRKNDSYGFDILSYKKNEDGSIENVYIEVKTTNGELCNQFFVSEKELEVSKTYSNNYKLVRVYNAGDKNEIKHKEFNGDISTNKDLEQLDTKSTLTYKVK